MTEWELKYISHHVNCLKRNKQGLCIGGTERSDPGTVAILIVRKHTQLASKVGLYDYGMSGREIERARERKRDSRTVPSFFFTSSVVFPSIKVVAVKNIVSATGVNTN